MMMSVSGAFTSAAANRTFHPTRIGAMPYIWMSEGLAKKCAVVRSLPGDGNREERAIAKRKLTCEAWNAIFNTARPWAVNPHAGERGARYFTNRNTPDIIRLSGASTADWDHFSSTKEASAFRDELFHVIPEVVLARLSSSYRGVHAVVHVANLACSGLSGTAAAEHYRLYRLALGAYLADMGFTKPADPVATSAAGFLYASDDPQFKLRHEAPALSLRVQMPSETSAPSRTARTAVPEAQFEPAGKKLRYRRLGPREPVLTDTELAKVLLLPGFDDYADWRAMGLRLKAAALTGSPEAACYEAWNAWSAQSSKYKEGECEEAWEKFKPDRTGAGKIRKMLKEI